MSVDKEQISNLLNNTSEAADLISRHVENEEVIHVTSHFDADGLAAAGIVGSSIVRSGGKVHIRVERWIDERVVNEIAAQKPSLTIFTDFGSGYLDLLNRKLSNRLVIIVDHHQLVGESPSTFTHVNPHIHGIDGARDLSGAGVAYLISKGLDEGNLDLAYLAIVGALGDIQDKYDNRRLGGVNEMILEDAVKSGYLKIETDLLFFGRETRPIHTALARATNPFIPGISGEEDKSLAFLASLGISPKFKEKWRALRDLSEEEKKKLFSALADYLVSKGFSSDVALTLIGSVYTLTREEPWTPLRDAREFAVLLNATGRMDKPGLGVSICMGDRGTALEHANIVLGEYRGDIAKYLDWLTEKTGRIQELDNIYVVKGEDFIDDKVIGTVSSILSTSLPKKPIVAYSRVPKEDFAKVSARSLELLISKGLNLGEIMRVAAEKFAGKGGGHNIAAGAQIPIESMESFIRIVDEFVKKQLEGRNLGG